MKGLLPITLMIACCWYVAEFPAGHRAVHVASLYVGHQETSANRSDLIDHWNRRLGLPAGSNYCASFLAFVLDSAQVDYPTVRSGVAQHYITRQSIPATHVIHGREIPAGHIAVWKRGNTWMGHVEIVREDWKGGSGLTIGANTTPGTAGDQRQGNGVYKRTRRIDQTAYFRITHFTPVY
jgi:hypothetical protein